MELRARTEALAMPRGEAVPIFNSVEDALTSATPSGVLREIAIIDLAKSDLKRDIFYIAYSRLESRQKRWRPAYAKGSALDFSPSAIKKGLESEPDLYEWGAEGPAYAHFSDINGDGLEEVIFQYRYDTIVYTGGDAFLSVMDVSIGRPKPLLQLRMSEFLTFSPDFRRVYWSDSLLFYYTKWQKGRYQQSVFNPRAWLYGLTTQYLGIFFQMPKIMREHPWSRLTFTEWCTTLLFLLIILSPSIILIYFFAKRFKLDVKGLRPKCWWILPLWLTGWTIIMLYAIYIISYLFLPTRLALFLMGPSVVVCVLFLGIWVYAKIVLLFVPRESSIPQKQENPLKDR